MTDLPPDMPNDAKEWLRLHPDYWTDPAKNRKLHLLHGPLVEKGLAPLSKEYFAALDRELGFVTEQA